MDHEAKVDGVIAMQILFCSIGLFPLGVSWLWEQLKSRQTLGTATTHPHACTLILLAAVRGRLQSSERWITPHKLLLLLNCTWVSELFSPSKLYARVYTGLEFYLGHRKKRTWADYLSCPASEVKHPSTVAACLWFSCRTDVTIEGLIVSKV